VHSRSAPANKKCPRINLALTAYTAPTDITLCNWVALIFLFVCPELFITVLVSHLPASITPFLFLFFLAFSFFFLFYF
jgi:hypothetical protein